MRKLFSLLISSNTDLPKDSLLVKLQWQETEALDQTLILRHQKILREILLVKGGEALRATFLLKRPSSFGRKSQDKLDISSATFLSDVQFTKADILQFVSAIGDCNPLHQQAPLFNPSLSLFRLFETGPTTKSFCLILTFFSASLCARKIITLLSSKGPLSV